jgi:hypothetical protein
MFRDEGKQGISAFLILALCIIFLATTALIFFLSKDQLSPTTKRLDVSLQVAEQQVAPGEPLIISKEFLESALAKGKSARITTELFSAAGSSVASKTETVGSTSDEGFIELQTPPDLPPGEYILRILIETEGRRAIATTNILIKESPSLQSPAEASIEENLDRLVKELDSFNTPMPEHTPPAIVVQDEPEQTDKSPEPYEQEESEESEEQSPNDGQGEVQDPAPSTNQSSPNDGQGEVQDPAPSTNQSLPSGDEASSPNQTVDETPASCSIDDCSGCINQTVCITLQTFDMRATSIISISAKIRNITSMLNLSLPEVQNLTGLLDELDPKLTEIKLLLHSINPDTTNASLKKEWKNELSAQREEITGLANRTRIAVQALKKALTSSDEPPEPEPTPEPTPPPSNQSNRPGIDKPIGIFSSADARGTGIYTNPNLRGVLIRESWAAIEPSPGVFDFSSITPQINNAKAHGQSWSLGILGGGQGHPSWLINSLGAPYIEFVFRGTPGYKLPLFWDQTVQERLRILADALGKQYNNDTSLKLVYITQMTSNGMEGHLQGVNMEILKNAGYTDDKWVEAGKQTAKNFAHAFPNKALAFEVHDVNDNADVPSRIINDLWNDSELDQRVGAAMWWLSGRTTYQAELLEVLEEYPGDIYGQVIAYSGDPNRQNEFGDGGFASVFPQAKELGIRYIEVWEKELKDGPGTANGAWDPTFADFNEWADATFLPSPTPEPIPEEAIA